jgi:hypothetical protein
MDILGQSTWLSVLVGGTIILALAIVYAMVRNRRRTLGERVATEAATREEYKAEDRDED